MIPMDEAIHPANRLNDLTNRQWLIETKSFWLSRAPQMAPEAAQALEEFTEWLIQHREPEEVERILGQLDPSFVFSKTPPRSQLKAQHPATFSELDVERLIRLFTKQGETVLDPFVGTGSTLLACRASGRRGLGVELSPYWADVARQRLDVEAPAKLGDLPCEVLVGDARDVLNGLDEESVDFIVTSPPYWSILTKEAGLKVRAERQSKGLPTRYSGDEADLGNFESYEEFLNQLALVFAACHRVLRTRRYMAVIVSDFRHGPRFYLYHADLAARVEAVGLQLKGVTILAQDSKSLYPFGIPYAFISNIHHQYILVFQKMPAPKARRKRPPQTQRDESPASVPAPSGSVQRPRGRGEERA
jgi:DNA modification methylase